MAARDVEVGEVGAVGFVDVSIAFVPGGPRTNDERLEESRRVGGRRERATGLVEMGEEAVEDAELRRS